MNHNCKAIFMQVFAILFCGCLPQERITGKVVDETGPVPGTAVLAMVWVEDAGKALPAPEVNILSPEDHDAALEKDMKTRGLPSAYARAFADERGSFALDRLVFSAETKEAVKAMKQPCITRVTLWAFQRGYRKQAVTTFPARDKQELANATMLLSRSADWKELYRENTVDSLTLDYMVKGYSKEFGATEAEKRWILEYTHSNLWKAYVDSDIKGDREMAELCGRDYGGVTVSTAGIAWDQSHERCAELKKRMGAVRDIEELWIAHANKREDPLADAKEVVKRAIALLPASAAEPKEYEAMILAGIEDAANAKNKGAVTSNPGIAWEEEAKLQYGSGNKAAAYRVLGGNIYTQLPVEVKQGESTAMLAATTLPKVKDAAAGFYLLMNRPLTAQLPGGDGGNHKDKPKGMEISSETVSETDAGIKLVEEELVFKDETGQLIVEPALNGPEEALKKHQPRKLKYIETKKMGVPRLYFKGRAGVADKILPLETKTEELDQGGDKKLGRQSLSRPVFSKNNKWVLVDRSIVETPYKVENGKKEYYSYDGQTTTGRFDLYDSHGVKRYSKEFVPGRGISGAYPNIVVADNGTVAVPTDDEPGGGNPIVFVFDASGQLILEYSHADVDIGGASIDKISPNGRYLAIRAGFNYASTVTVFFDLKTKKTWKAEQDYVIYEMTNDGLVECDYYDDKKQAPSPTVVMDIKPYLRE